MAFTLILCGIVAGGALLGLGRSRLLRNDRTRETGLGLRWRGRS